MAKIVQAHDQVRELLEVIHYPTHPKRTDSEEFIRNREYFHKQHAKCWIDNGYCKGPIEIHHFYIEWASANSIDWEKVKKDLGFDHCDDIKNLMPLCHRHHQGVGTGIHNVSYNAWILQKYMKPEDLALFEQAVQHLIHQGHDTHHINRTADKMLLHLAKRKGDGTHGKGKRGIHQHARNV